MSMTAQLLAPGIAAPSVPAPDTPRSKVAVLLTTKQGQRFLAEQLESIESQTHSRWELWVSDDGSDDETPLILDHFRSRWAGRWEISRQRGPQRGFAANFVSLVRREEVRADFYAYCDQDDIWEPWKLERAIQWLSELPSTTPALYCSRTRLVDARGKHLGFSPLFTRKPGFANALIQNIGGGNTMVFNDAARNLLLAAGDDLDVVSHDWWTYLAVTGCGGTALYDPEPSVRYRQHANNLVGANRSWSARVHRAGMMFNGCFKAWNDVNIGGLERLRPRLTPDNQRLLDQFCELRGRPLVGRVAGLRQCGLYRQTGWGTAGVFAAALLGKL